MKHSMTFDGRFGISVEEYVIFRALHKTTEINNRTWHAYTSPIFHEKLDKRREEVGGAGIQVPAGPSNSSGSLN